MRQGVDEESVADVLRGTFADVRVERYWSTQSGWLQRLGDRWATPNTFGVEAHRAFPSERAPCQGTAR